MRMKLDLDTASQFPACFEKLYLNFQPILFCSSGSTSRSDFLLPVGFSTEC